MGEMMISEKIRLSLLSLWLGVMAFFSFVVAPAAFAVLPEQRFAGNVVNRVLGITEVIGLVLGIVILLFLLFARVRHPRQYYLELGTVALATVSIAISHFGVSRWMHELRLKGGENFYLLPAGDPIRASFDQLHQASVGLTGIAMLAALFVIVTIIRRDG